MYFPKSQIKTNLYTNGDEYSIKGRQAPYVGYYWKTSQNKFYTGKTPESGTNLQLIPLYPTFSSNEDSTEIPLEGYGNTIQSLITLNSNGVGDVDPTYNFSTELRNEMLIMQYENTNPITQQQGRMTPSYYRTLPPGNNSQDKYNRYFAKQNNASIFIEVSQETFKKFNSEDSMAATDLYTCLSLPWSTQENASQINKFTVNKIEKDNNWYGFYQYFQGKFDDTDPKSESLYTNGGEFLLPNRTNYIGYYHFMPNGIAMTGKNHSDGEDIVLISIASNTPPTLSTDTPDSNTPTISPSSGGGGGY